MLAALILAAGLVHVPPPVRGDFDHDGKPDVAEFVQMRSGDYELIIRRGARGHPVAVIKKFKRSEFRYFYLDKAKPGRWQTWCGKYGGPENDPCPRKFVNLRGDTLDFGVEESSESVVIWTGKRFEVVLFSD